MKQEIERLRDVITKITKMLAGSSVTVTQRGSQAYVTTNLRTGKAEVINIPYLADDAPVELVLAIQGFIDHEVGHVLFTDTLAAVRITAGDPRKHSMHNIVEDPFVENSMQRMFPGSKSNLGLTREFFIEKVTRPEIAAALAAGDLKKAANFLMVPIARAWAGQEQFEAYLQEIDAYNDPRFKRLFETLTPFRPRFANLTSTESNAHLAVEIIKALDPSEREKEERAKKEEERKKEERREKRRKKKEEKEKAEKAEKAGKEKAEKEKAEEEEKEKAGGEGSPEEPGEGTTEEPDDTDDAGDASEDGAASGKPEDGADEKGDTSEADADDEAEPDDDIIEEDGAPADADGEDEGRDGSDEDDVIEEDGSEDEDDASSGDSDEGESDEDEAADDKGADDEDGSIGSKSDEATDAGDDGEGGEDDGRESGDGREGGAGDEGDGEGEVAIEMASPDAALPVGDFDAYADLLGKILADGLVDAMRKADYRVFSTDADIVEKYPYRTDPRNVARIDDVTRKMVGAMQKHIERMMAARSVVQKVPGFRSGKLHSASLHRIVTGDDRLFRRKLEAKSTDVVVSLLIDLSGSMRGRKMETAALSGYALSATLERCAIRHEVLGFTTINRLLTPEFTRAMEEEERRLGRHFARREGLYLPILKEFAERITPEVRVRFAAAAYEQKELRNNLDAESVELAVRRLHTQKEKRRVLLVLSDGAPCALGDVGAQGRRLRGVLEEAEKSGVECVGIGILDKSVQRYYRRHMVLEKLEELPVKVMDELKRILAV